MDNEDFENELNVPSLEKLESMSQLFEHAMSGIEQELFLRYMFMRGIEPWGLRTQARCSCKPNRIC
jgi:hypothetical protein